MATQTDTTPAAQLHGALESFFETKTACDVEGTMAGSRLNAIDTR